MYRPIDTDADTIVINIIYCYMSSHTEDIFSDQQVAMASS